MKIINYASRQDELEGFDLYSEKFGFTSKSLDIGFGPETADLAQGFDAITIVGNCNCNKEAIEKIHSLGVKYIGIRAAGYNNIDLETCKKLNIRVSNVPAYSPNSVSDGLRSRSDSKKAALLGMIMNVFLILSVAILLFAYPQFINETLPNYMVVEVLGFPILLFAYVAMVVLAVTSTAVSYAFSTVARYSQFIPLEKGPKRDLVTVILLFVATFFVSLLGLDVIVGKGYKYLGYIVIPTVILPIILTGSKKIRESKIN